MNTLTATRLGKVDAGKEKNLKPGDIGNENIAAPIVLWSKDVSQAIPLYLRTETGLHTGIFKQKIDYLQSGKGVKGLLKSVTGAYPITFKAHGRFEEKDFKAMDSFSYFYTKDINGDGIDELIITRKHGGIEVYDRQKQIFRYKPKSDPKLYEYKISRSYNNPHDHDEIGNHDEMFFTIEQDPYDRKNASSRDTWIVRLSPAGFTEIHPVFPDHSEPSVIRNVIGMNRPGSNKIDELIVISLIKGQKGDYLSRHNLDGTGIDAPREIYTEYGIYGGICGLSGSNQLIMWNGQEQMSYIVTPDKPVNWIKTIDKKKLFGKDTKAQSIGSRTINNLTVLILEDRGKLYALDALGKFHTSLKPDSHISNTPVAFMTLKPDSNKHTIIEIKPTDKTMESFLVIQSRGPGKRDMSLEELEKAGKKFLTDDNWKRCKEKLRLKYRETTPELAESYCRRNNIPMPEIHSWEDIKKKLPGYYEQKVKQSIESYRSALETELFPSIRGEYVLKEGDFKNIEEYRKWLENVFVQPELVFSIQHITKGSIGHQRLTDYYFHDLEVSPGFTQPTINVRANGEHGQAFMALHKKLFNQKDIKPAYYGIAW